MKKKINPFTLYEVSVQSPEVHIEVFNRISEELLGKKATRLREDFCGTYWLCSEWVKHDPENTALALDLDPAPLHYGYQNHWKKLTPAQRKRLIPVQADVLKPVPKKSGFPKKPELIVACNFSINIFKKRALMLEYFKNSLKSLDSKGALILEIAGGPGMITQSREQKTLYLETKGKKQKFTYIWDQKSFDPITHDALYAIHFKFPESPPYKDCFVYDWRLWTLPELKDLLHEAGFSSTHVYWEAQHKGEGTGEYIEFQNGDNAHAWIAYLIGINCEKKRV